MMRKSVFWLLTAVFLALFAGLAFRSDDDPNDFEVIKHLDIFYSLFRDLNYYYVDETNPGKLIQLAVNEMLSTLDPYTIYIPETRIEDYRAVAGSDFGYPPLAFVNVRGHLLVREVIEGSELSTSVFPGDELVEVNGQSLAGLTLEQAELIIRGQVNTPLEMVVLSLKTKSLKKVSTMRRQVRETNIAYAAMPAPGVCYVKVANFMENATADLYNAIHTTAGKSELSGIVLDLRDNPGGLLTEAVSMVNLFVDRGQFVVAMRGKNKKMNRTFSTQESPVYKDVPVVVLINSQSASASEIVAGALQDLDRAVIVGQRSFGKGLVQNTLNLPYNSLLKLTIAKYYIPSGRCIQALDYTHRNADGSVGRVPDSLATAFKTRAGRIVYDGGGIMPDVETPGLAASPLLSTLFSSHFLFEFSSRFLAQRDSISAPAAFRLQDSDYEDFVAYLREVSFYKYTRSYARLQQFHKQLSEEAMITGDDVYVSDNEQFVSVSIEKQIIASKPLLVPFLEEEIVGQRYFDSGRMKYLIENDDEVMTALRLLQDPAAYRAIFVP